MFNIFRKKDDTDSLLQKRNVVGVGSVDGSTVVFVNRKLKMSTIERYIRDRSKPWTKDDVVPSHTIIDGLPRKTSVVEIGDVKAVSTTLPNRQQYRPIQPGCEISPVSYGFVGTLGCFVKYKTWMGRPLVGSLSSFVPILEMMGVSLSEKVGFITNAHVAHRNVLTLDNEILVQPGNRGISFSVGDTLYSHPFRRDGRDEFDVALCSIDNNRSIDRTFTISGKLALTVGSFKVGEMVCKDGRTTGYTEGEQLIDNVSINVDFGSAGMIRLRGLQMYDMVVRGGDSGSVARNKKGEVIGLVFAASPNASFAIPFDKVLRVTGCELV